MSPRIPLRRPFRSRRSRRSPGALAVPVLLAALAPAAGRAAPPATDGASYEALATGAVRTHDVATLLTPFVDRCDGERREIDRARCRGTTAYLRQVLPRRTFSFVTDDPATIAVSDYDASVKGYHLSLAGCIACTKPVGIGPAGEPRLITVKVPDKDAESLAKAVAISRNTFGFDSLPEARHWLDSERPFLRAEFLFQPSATTADAEWSFRAERGVAVKLIGARVYNRCTGEVLVSKPPSTGMAERPLPGADERACGAVATPNRAAATPAGDPAAEAAIPPQLTKGAIADAMAKIRPQLFACYQKFQVPGTLELTYDVAGNGTVQSVQVGAAFAGTPTGLCALAVAKDAHFLPFKLERQKFSYPFFLRQ